MRVLALDHGSARCGCALSDPTGTLATPIGAIQPPYPQRVAELVAEHGVERVIVGLAVTLDGERGAQAAEGEEFAVELARVLEVPVECYDERLTTRMAERSARSGARSDSDSLAAAHLLESYLAAAGARARKESGTG